MSSGWEIVLGAAKTNNVTVGYCGTLPQICQGRGLRLDGCIGCSNLLLQLRHLSQGLYLLGPGGGGQGFKLDGPLGLLDRGIQPRIGAGELPGSELHDKL